MTHQFSLASAGETHRNRKSDRLSTRGHFHPHVFTTSRASTLPRALPAARLAGPARSVALPALASTFTPAMGPVRSLTASERTSPAASMAADWGSDASDSPGDAREPPSRKRELESDAFVAGRYKPRRKPARSAAVRSRTSWGVCRPFY